MLAVGMMSGTSLDGIDTALIEVAPRDEHYAVELLRFQTHPFDERLARQLHAALPPNSGSVADVAELHRALGEAFSRAAQQIVGKARVGFVASHGQTLWHDGARSITLQVGDPFIIRERVGASVCYDFRSADCAVGGQGAPLVPYVDALLFGSSDEDLLAINIGGIANVSLVRKGKTETIAFDSGPGNMLMDAFVRERTDRQQAMDHDGALAWRGTVDSTLLKAMLADEYFAQPPPKSTGRERFGAQFLARHHERLSQLSLEDGLATLAELTAASIADAVRAFGFEPARAILSGGGAHNRQVVTRLAARLAPARIELSDTLGIPADAKEAITFALLGYETLRGRVANLPHATGAREAVCLGAIAPYRLSELLAAVERECRASS
ncbi:MAG: anhydro-N-acetylmuramic acid kinase [Candidatus Eremiobacteraeota bacterium]|nr:anhydro-N-acetylmuramic acid kinase [Candidatus Eremiobacteraeota bacterium]